MKATHLAISGNKEATMQETIARIRKFRDDRDWKQFHDPKNLAVSISVEAAELLEIFQWMTGEQAAQHAAQNKERVSEEIADVAIYLIELADIVGIDLAVAIDAKLDKNAKKYPVEKARGVSTKYTDFK
jgi:dCTP diphosphatase